MYFSGGDVEKIVAIALCLSLILFIAGFGLVAFSNTAVTTTIPTESAYGGNTANSWEVSEPFQANETLVLYIQPGDDWGSVSAAEANGTFPIQVKFPVQLNVTFQASDGGGASFSCWYNFTRARQIYDGGLSALTLTLLNATVIENNASQSLEPVSNCNAVSCLVKADVNVTASLDKTSVYYNFGSVESPPYLGFTYLMQGWGSSTDYPYTWYSAPGIFLAMVAVMVFVSTLAYAVLEKTKSTEVSELEDYRALFCYKDLANNTM
jgi:hypothetical protein